MVECEYSCFFIYSDEIVSFNRYMVECEFVSDKKGLQVTIGFNRYMVECECFTWSDKQLWFWVLIDTWWNVNNGINSMGLQVQRF